MNDPLRIIAVGCTLVLSLTLLTGPRLSAQEGPTASEESAETASTETASAEQNGEPKKESAEPEAAKSQEVQLEGIFEAVKVAPVSLNPEEWAELKVLEAVPHGTQVERGEVLVRLETEGLDKAIHDAEIELKLERLSLAEAEFKLGLLDRNQRMALKAAEDAERVATEDLKEFLTRGRDERLASVDQSEKSARNRLAYEEEELKQLERMYQADDLTEETEEIILKRTRDSVDAARYSLKMVLSSGRNSREYTIPRSEDGLKDAVKKAVLALEEVREGLPTQRKQQELQLQKQREALEQKEERLAKLRVDRRRMEIKAPRAGVVYYGECKRGKWTDPSAIMGMLQPGAVLKARVVIMSIVQTEPLQLRVAVPEASLRHVRDGAEWTVSPVAYPDAKLPARVREVSAIPIADGIFDAILKVDTTALDQRLVPGMKAKLTLTADAK